MSIFFNRFWFMILVFWYNIKSNIIYIHVFNNYISLASSFFCRDIVYRNLITILSCFIFYNIYVRSQILDFFYNIHILDRVIDSISFLRIFIFGTYWSTMRLWRVSDSLMTHIVLQYQSLMEHLQLLHVI